MHRKIGIMALSFVFVATIMLGAFAMWSETLRINATIKTGTVAVAFDEYSCGDVGPDPQSGAPFNNSEGKDVAKCYVSDEIIEDGNVVKLNVTIVNAYPGYEAQIKMSIKNVGTIPVKLYSQNISGVNTTALSVSLTHEGNTTQIHPGSTQTYLLTIDVLQQASENTTYTFEVTLVFAQWNEVSTP